MFIVSMRCRNLGRKLAVLAAAGAVCAAVVIWNAARTPDAPEALPQQETQLVWKGSQGPDPSVPDNDARLRYLTAFGWEVASEPQEVVEVLIPQSFNAVYERYNEIQKAQGMDLERYQGKTVKRYTYSIQNYPDRPEYVRANILVYRDQVIAGDVCSVEARNGFMHGLKLPEEDSSQTGLPTQTSEPDAQEQDA